MEKKVNKKELVKKGSKTLTEFKNFIAKGNVIDLAVGVIIGSAFGKIVTSVVNDIFTGTPTSVIPKLHICIKFDVNLSHIVAFKYTLYFIFLLIQTPFFFIMFFFKKFI